MSDIQTSNTRRLDDGRIARRYRILMTDTVVHVVYEPTNQALDAPQGAGHRTITHIDEVCVGKLTSRDLPAEIQALPVGDERFRAVKDYHEALYRESMHLLLGTFGYLRQNPVTWSGGDAEVQDRLLAATVARIERGIELEDFAWQAVSLANPPRRYTLLNGGVRTKYFIDRERYPADRERPYGLYGAGMSPGGSAGTLGHFARLAEAKAAAEGRWRADQTHVNS